MKYRKYADVVVPAGETITSPAFHIPPRYNEVENTLQRIAGAAAYDVLVQGLPAYPNPDEIYGGPTTDSLALETDWIDIVQELGVNPDHDFLAEPNQYGYYRVKISSGSNVTVRWECIGLTTSVFDLGTGPEGLPGIDGGGSGSGSGQDGATGATGPAGADGLPGMDGLSGSRGPMGPQGPQGDGDVAQLNLEMDDTEAGTLYVGESAPGSDPGDAAWRIKRIVETGPDLSIEWADGNANFDNVWSDRLILSYD